MATYYVRITGNDITGDGSEDNPWLTPTKALTYIAASGSGANTIDIGPGLFDAGAVIAMRLNNAKYANLIIQGAGRLLTRILSSAGTGCIYTDGSVGDNIIINDLTIDNSIGWGFYKHVADITMTINRCDIKGLGNNGALICYQTTQLNANNVRLFWENGDAISLQGPTNAKFNNCIGMNAGIMGSGDFSGRWICNNSGDAIFNNCEMLDGKTVVLYKTNAAANVTGNNCVIQGCTNNTAEYPVEGVITLNNCLVPANLLTGDRVINASVIANDCKLGYEPGFFRPMKGGFIIPCIDDASNYATSVLTLEALLEAKNMQGTFFPEYASINGGGTCPTTQNLVDLIGRGTMEVGSHSVNHSNTGYTHALYFTHVAGIVKTVAFDGTTITATCDGSSTTYNVTAASTLGDVIAAFNGVDGWTCERSFTDGQTASYISTLVLASSLKTQVATDAPCDIDFDVSGYDVGYFYNEITQSRNLLNTLLGAVVDPQTGLSYVCNSFAPPYNGTTADSRTATRLTGYIIGRATGFPKYLTGIDLYNNCALQAELSSGADEDAIRQRARAIGFGAAQTGLLIFLYAHTLLDITADEWEWAIDEWSKIANLTVTSSQLVANHIRESGLWADGGSGVWSRTYDMTDTSGLKLMPDSPCRDAGVVIAGLTTDFEGKPVPMGSAPDIGAYEFPVPSPMGLNLGLGGGGRMIPPRRRRR